MKINVLAKRRKISNELITPLIIPSFSSTIFGIQDKESRKDLSNFYKFFQEKISNALYSLYDIHQNYIEEEILEIPETLILDSGSYEYLKYKKAGFRVKWNNKMYNDTINKLNRKKTTIQVNCDVFDDVNKQIDAAIGEYKNNYLKDFIIKPNKRKIFIDVSDVMSNIDKLSEFNIIGLTEKELGDTLLEKCQNIIKIRSRLYEEGIELPIHLFGVLDQLSIILYSFCGADIFDGLSWAKNGFINNFAIYDDNYALLKGYFEFNDDNLLQIMLINNLEVLSTIRTKIVEFTQSYNWNVFDLNLDTEEKMKLLLSSSGIDVSVKI